MTIRGEYSRFVEDDHSELSRDLGEQAYSTDWHHNGLDRNREPFSAEEERLAFSAALGKTDDRTV